MCSLGRAAGRRVVPGEAEQVVALVERQVQALRDRGDHLLRRLRPALPLEPGVVVGRHVAQRGDLLAPQPAGAAALPARQPDVLGLQRLPAAAQELRQPGSIDHHASSSGRPCRTAHAAHATDRRSVADRQRIDGPWIAGRPATVDERRTDRPRGAPMPRKHHRHHRPRPHRQARRRHRRQRRHRPGHRRRGSPPPAPRWCCPSATRARARRRSPTIRERRPDARRLAARARPVLAGLGRRPGRRPCATRAARSTS